MSRKESETKSLLIYSILIPAIKCLYQMDHDNIRFGVSERNICARLAHHMENIMREYDHQHEDSPFIGYYADVEYNRMGNGDPKHFENSEHLPQYMVSDLLIQSRGIKENLLAVEMKKMKSSEKDMDKDRERLKSLVSPNDYKSPNIRCVHDTKLGTFIVYSPDEVVIEFYESVNGHGQLSNIRKIIVEHEGGSRNLYEESFSNLYQSSCNLH